MNNNLYMYPFDNWNNLFISDSILKNPAMCLCFFDEINGYKWDENILKNIQKIIGVASTFRTHEMRLIKNDNFILQGLCFLGEKSIEKIEKSFLEFRMRKIKEKHKKIENNLEHTAIDNLFAEDKLKITQINKIIEEGYEFMYIHRYINKSGLTFIFFNKNIIDKIILKLSPTQVSSYDDLKDW